MTAVAVLDHLVLATADLAATTAAVAAATGVTPSRGGSHVGVGTANTLLALGGGAYLEVIGPDPAQGAVDGPRPFGVDALVHSGEARLATFAVRVTDIDAVIATARAAGYDPGEARSMQRATPDGGLLAWRLTSPPAWGAGVVPFLIDWGVTVHPSTTSASGATLSGFSVGHPDPSRIAEVFAALALDVVVTEAATPTLQAVVSGPTGAMLLTG